MDFSQAEQQIKALGQKTYELARMKWSEEKNRSMSISDLLTVEEITGKQSRIEIEIKNGENWYIRADYRPHVKHDIIFIDDNTPAGEKFLRNQGIIPACIVQTSTRNDGTPSLHCWYRMPECLDVQTRKAVEKVLLNRLHAQFPHPDHKKRPGDTGSNDGMHRGRLAGTWNFGLGKERNCPVTLIEAPGYILSQEVAENLLTEATQFIDYSPKLKPSDSLLEIENHKYENPKIIQWYKENVIPKMNNKYPHYQQDVFAASRMLKAKFCELDIKKVLLEYDPNPILERKQGHEAHFLENIIQEAKKNNPQQTPKTPQTQGGGEVLLPLAGACASVPPSSFTVANPGALAPEPEKSFTGIGKIDLSTGKIQFNAEKLGTSPSQNSDPEPQLPQSIPAKNPTSKTPAFLPPKRKRFGVRPRVVTAGPKPKPKP